MLYAPHIHCTRLTRTLVCCVAPNAITQTPQWRDERTSLVFSTAKEMPHKLECKEYQFVIPKYYTFTSANALVSTYQIRWLNSLKTCQKFSVLRRDTLPPVKQLRLRCKQLMIKSSCFPWTEDVVELEFVDNASDKILEVIQRLESCSEFQISRRSFVDWTDNEDLAVLITAKMRRHRLASWAGMPMPKMFWQLIQI